MKILVSDTVQGHDVFPENSCGFAAWPPSPLSGVRWRKVLLTSPALEVHPFTAHVHFLVGFTCWHWLLTGL